MFIYLLILYILIVCQKQLFVNRKVVKIVKKSKNDEHFLTLEIKYGIINVSRIERSIIMYDDYVITGLKAGTDVPYLSAIFRDNKLIGIIQNKKFSSDVKTEDVAKFLLAIKSDERYYPKDIAAFMKNNLTVVEAIDDIRDNHIVELDF